MRSVLVVVAAAGALAASAPAGAATWIVSAGQPTKPPKGVPKGVFLNQFFPSRLEIRVGDRIMFVSKDFHTATFLGAKKPSEVPLLMPDPAGSTYAGITDAAGVPFFFNGLTRFLYNAQVIQPAGSQVITPGGFHNSGVLVFRGKKGYTYTFTRPGTYKVFCQVHPFMEGTIVVRPRRARVASPRTVETRVSRQLSESWNRARSLSRRVPSQTGTVFAGVGKSVALLTFQPKQLTVPVGTTVTWVNDSPSEVHNVAFGDPAWIDSFLKRTDLIPVGPGQANQLSPVFVYGSEPGASIHHGTNHGNGFLATPVMDALPGDPPQGAPGQSQITFTKPGSYHYFCLIHGKEMSGDIVVR